MVGCVELLSVFPGRTAEHLLKPSAKVAGCTETAVFADLRDAFFPFQQHAGGFADPVLMQVLNGGHPEAPLETPGTFPLADGGGIRDIL